MAGFIPEAGAIARRAMEGVDPGLADKYVEVIEFLAFSPQSAGSVRGNSRITVGSANYIDAQARAFARGRGPNRPPEPTTVPDDLVSFILEQYFDVPMREEAAREHQLAMAAENIVGDLLERYLATVIEPSGWVWCSGSVVKAADFIKRTGRNPTSWSVLQVKNRDNSENSSSSAIRHGTTIEKWFRSFSRRPAWNWERFPDADQLPMKLSEGSFKKFVEQYLKQLRG